MEAPYLFLDSLRRSKGISACVVSQKAPDFLAEALDLSASRGLKFREHSWNKIPQEMRAGVVVINRYPALTSLSLDVLRTWARRSALPPTNLCGMELDAHKHKYHY